MKLILFLHIAALLLICSCNSFYTRDEVQELIPGMYIRFSQHEFGTEYDTLVITLQNKTANEYKILRKWKYERMMDGTVIEPEYKRLTTSGIYNIKHKILQEAETGDVFSFDVKKKLLFSGLTQYKKIK
ncbi:MAG: hypothetical protein ABI675_17995 [Chitinophagaceae bacterium]